MNTIGTRANWYPAALALRQEMERNGDYDKAKRFIHILLTKCGSREDAIAYVEREKEKYNGQRTIRTVGTSNMSIDR